ncbi:hypothetical protein NE237_004801 [Protea cynaroides]|uniref:WAT1-related protein n=1 Tax=Protea cynaroides TaxID=273540 RepID=A0A9Q0KJJ5_9MAGN|nr:hypothetical protein NE237_004801 [Protea cynaroides]
MGTMKTCLPYMAMVVVQLAYSGFTILMKISLNSGLSQFVFIVYRHLIAMLFLGPFAYVLERKQRPSMSLSIMIKIFVLSSIGTTVYLNVYYTGLNYTSPTVACALGNVIPGFTFVMALLLRMEKVRIKSAKGSAKVIGTLICIAGALTFTFWKEGYLFESFFKNPLIDINPTGGSVHGLRHHKEDWIKGALLILTSYIAWSAWLILQSLVFSVYPAPLSLNTLICFFASLQTSVLALIFERDPASWRLEWNVQLLTIFYSGIVNSGFVSYLQTWCIGKKGPVFSAMFTPLSLLIVGIFSAIFFAEQLHLGSLIGAFFTVVGLYTVLWGKSTDTCSEDKKVGNDRSSLDHQTLEIPIADQPLSMAIPITTGKN